MIILKGGYQISSSIESAVITKIKGTTEINLNENPRLNQSFDQSKIPLFNRIWDGQDIVYPPKDSSGFFLTSNIVITKNQTLGKCPDLSSDECDPAKAPKECLDKQSVLSDGKINRLINEI